MKRLWYVAVLVAVAFGICFTEIYAVKNSCDTFIQTIDESRVAMENNDFDKANKLSYELIDKWNKKEIQLNYLLEHSVLDEISMDIEQLPEYTNKDSKDDYLSANDRIKKQFNVLYTNELPYGHNIF